MKSLQERITLGTVQFGLDYGINNRTGKISFLEIEKILSYCFSNHINMLDTAAAYGNSESLIGKVTETNGFNFKVVSKLPNCKVSEVHDIIIRSLQELKVDSMYGYLMHDFGMLVQYPQIWSILEGFRKEGKIQKIGFSVYKPEDIHWLLDHQISFDLIQLPYNIFDRRFESLFPILKTLQVEIHTRSVFLQGLFFMDPNSLSTHFNSVKNKLGEFRKLLTEYDIPIYAALLNYVFLNPYIDQIVIGVDSLSNLVENMNADHYLRLCEEIYLKLNTFVEHDEKILLPMNWKNDDLVS